MSTLHIIHMVVVGLPVVSTIDINSSYKRPFGPKQAFNVKKSPIIETESPKPKPANYPLSRFGLMQVRK